MKLVLLFVSVALPIFGQANTCTCDNGTPASGTECLIDAEERCVDCNNGYMLTGNHCIYNLCTIDSTASIPDINTGVASYLMFLTKEITELKEQLALEKEEKNNLISALTIRADDEETARINAVDSLITRVDDEEAERINAVDSLTTRADAVEDDVTALTTQVSSGEVNLPYFSARPNFSESSTGYELIVPMALNEGSNYGTFSSNKWTVGSSGVWVVTGQVYGWNKYYCYLSLVLNGSSLKYSYWGTGDTGDKAYDMLLVTAVQYFNSGDELWLQYQGTVYQNSDNYGGFSAYKIFN